MNDLLVVSTTYGEMTVNPDAVVGVRVSPGKSHAERDEWDAVNPPNPPDVVRSWERPTPTACVVVLILSAGLASVTIYSEAVDGVSEEARSVYEQMIDQLRAFERPVVVHEHRLSSDAAATLGESAVATIIAGLSTAPRHATTRT